MASTRRKSSISPDGRLGLKKKGADKPLSAVKANTAAELQGLFRQLCFSVQQDALSRLPASTSESLMDVAGFIETLKKSQLLGTPNLSMVDAINICKAAREEEAFMDYKAFVKAVYLVSRRVGALPSDILFKMGMYSKATRTPKEASRKKSIHDDEAPKPMRLYTEPQQTIDWTAPKMLPRLTSSRRRSDSIVPTATIAPTERPVKAAPRRVSVRPSDDDAEAASSGPSVRPWASPPGSRRQSRTKGHARSDSRPISDLFFRDYSDATNVAVTPRCRTPFHRASDDWREATPSGIQRRVVLPPLNRPSIQDEIHLPE